MIKRTMLLLCALAVVTAAGAQTIPADSDILTGKLANGMTYYLCHNANPAGCAEFYIAHNVGALQEEDNQNGLAHFLEHMAFNGTKHYPEKGILEFLATEGVRFGYNVNAYTAKTETVYNLSNVPLVRDSFIDSVLMVLHDWSCDISCEQQALDDERGVISEEWRLGNDTRSRMARQQSALIYKDSKQAERTVIGTLEVINGFKREEILDFYHKWYRPDLQAIIVVGDFDTEAMEARVKRLFSDIPAAVNPEPKGEYIPPVHPEPLFADMTDPEIKYQAYKAFYKQRATITDHGSAEFYKDFMCRQVVNAVLADRLMERCKAKECPVQNATAVTNSYSPDMYVTMFTVVPRGKHPLLECVGFTETEIQRLLRHGISNRELEAAKLHIGQRMHLDNIREREDIQSREIVNCILASFLNNAPLVLPGTMQAVRRDALEGITAEDIAPYPELMFEQCEKIYSNSYNNVKEPDAAPTAEQMQQLLAAARAADIAPAYKEYPELDLNVEATPGTIVKTAPVKGMDFEKWKLSNGITVFYKHAAPAEGTNHLSMTWLFDTGLKALEQDSITAARFAINYLKRNAGSRGHNHSEYNNYPEMSGVSLMIGGGTNSAKLDVTARADKIETAFKAAWLQIMEPYVGNERELGNTKASTLKSLGKEPNPRNLFDEKTLDMFYGGHPWMHKIDSTAVEAVQMPMLEDVWKRSYSDIASLRVIICSDLDEALIRDMVCKYVASLSAAYPYKKGKYLPAKPAFKGDLRYQEQHDPVSEPLTDISYDFLSKVGNSPRERAEVEFLDYIMSARYLNLIREERGGAYSVFMNTDVSNEKAVPTKSSVHFQTRPEMKDILLGDIQDEMDRMCSSGPTAEEMELALKYLVKHYYETEKKVSRSLPSQENRMLEYVRWGLKYGYDAEKIYRSVTTKDIRRIARKINSGQKAVLIYEEK
ncbi:MAG: insulinase family protein [Bacteroidales bacterium]|nr:insulinase family protein [Bacteroidales bacterium]